MIVTAGLAGWRGWLQLKSREFDRTNDMPYPPASSAASRIEMADLKERIRKLEAIARGRGPVSSMRAAPLRRWTARIGCGGAVILAAVVHTPAALAFPHRADFGSTTVLSEQPIDRAAMGRVLARADHLLAASPLDRPGLSRQYSDRWRLAMGCPVDRRRSAIAFRRPFSHALVFNRSSVAADRVTNGAPLGGVRTLSGTIAHEMTHRLVADHIGEWAALACPPGSARVIPIMSRRRRASAGTRR